MSGYVLYHQGLYNEAILTLVPLMRDTDLSQQTKAFIHNLLGSCLAKQVNTRIVLQMENFYQLKSAQFLNVFHNTYLILTLIKLQFTHESHHVLEVIYFLLPI